MRIFISLILVFSALQVRGFVSDPAYDELESDELVSALIKDGKLDLAWTELKKPGLKKTNTSRYQLLLGQYYFARGEWKKSIDALDSVPTGSDKLLADVVCGRSYFQLKSYRRCAAAYKLVSLLPTEQDVIFKASCEFEEKNYSASLESLKAGQTLFSSFAIERELVAQQIRLQLVHEALVRTLNWFGRHSAFPSQYLDVAENFHQRGHSDAAIAVLETGRSVYPSHLDINLTLSQLYFQKNLLLASEEGFARAAREDSKYFYHAAEVNRQLGRFQRAQFFNGFIVDPKEKIKQKIATYVDSGKFPMIASLETTLRRSDLSADDEIKYALAYSLVKMGQIESPLTYLSSITKPELVEKSMALRKALIECQAKDGVCRL